MLAAYIPGVSAIVYSLFLEQQMMCIVIHDTHGLYDTHGSQLVISFLTEP